MKVLVKGLNPCAVRDVKVNQYRDYIVSCGHELVDDPNICDKILVWSCGFRSDYRDHSVNTAREYRDTFKKEVILAGCAPDIDRKLVESNFPESFVNWKNDEKLMESFFGNGEVQLSDIKLDLGEKRLVVDSDEFKKQFPDRDVCYLDTFVKLHVSEGCPLDCAYCTEKRMFPPYKSFPKADLVDTFRKLSNENNDYEVMLQADSAGDYGTDVGSSLPDLMDALFSVHKDVRIGIQGFNPGHFLKFKDYFINRIKENRISHLRLPIQSATDKMLTLMKRPYKRADIFEVFNALDEVGFDDFSTDMIIGFPGEKEADYLETLDFILSHKPKYVLLSSYMDSEILPSYKLSDKVEQSIIDRRMMHADKVFGLVNIHCSSNTGPLSAERRRRLSIINN